MTKPKTPAQKWPWITGPVINYDLRQSSHLEFERDAVLVRVLVGPGSTVDVEGVHFRELLRAITVARARGIVAQVGNRAPLWAQVLEQIFVQCGLLPRDPREAVALILRRLCTSAPTPVRFRMPLPSDIDDAVAIVGNELLDAERTRWLIATTPHETAGGRTGLMTPWDAASRFAGAFAYALRRRRDALRVRLRARAIGSST